MTQLSIHQLLPSKIYQNQATRNLNIYYLLVYNKNLISDLNFGSLDLNTNLEVKNYDVNKQTEFFVNDLIWESPTKINDFGFETQYLAKMKAVSYNADNTSKFKNENKNYENYGALGFVGKITNVKRKRR